MTSRSRRSVLHTTAVGLGVFLAGCSNTSERSSDDDNIGDGDNDDNVDDGDNKEDQQEMQPPGSPPLDASGAWPSPRYDAGNTGANPEGVGVKNGTTYWQLEAGESATFADDTLYNTTSDALTYRDPATAEVETHINLDGPHRSPVVRNNHVFVIDSNQMRCFDAETGEMLWSGPELERITGVPTVHEGIVVVNASDYKTDHSHLRAFDAAKGEELWRYDLDHRSRSTPAVGNNRVFVSSEGGLHAIELESGEEAYTVTEAIDSPHAIPVVNDGIVFAINPDSKLVAADTSDGTVHWQHPASFGLRNPSPVVTEEVVYAASPHGDRITALDSRDGSVISSNSLPESHLPLGLVGDVLYTAGEGTLSAFDTENGLEFLWSLETGGLMSYEDAAPPRINGITPVDGAVYVSARDGFYGVGPQQ